MVENSSHGDLLLVNCTLQGLIKRRKKALPEGNAVLNTTPQSTTPGMISAHDYKADTDNVVSLLLELISVS